MLPPATYVATTGDQSQGTNHRYPLVSGVLLRYGGHTVIQIPRQNAGPYGIPKNDSTSTEVFCWRGLGRSLLTHVTDAKQPSLGASTGARLTLQCTMRPSQEELALNAQVNITPPVHAQ